jgi:UDP-N-acetylglucosamine:LPS N-acetylglucosamine transferase
LERYRPLTAAAIRLVTLLTGSRTASLIDDRTRAVVSTYPLASQVFGWMRRKGQLDAPAATFLCDMSVHPLWVAAGVDAHLAMHKVAADQATSLGASGVTVIAPVVRAEFRVESAAPPEVARARFGLPVDDRVALVLAGSWGVGDISQTMIDLAASGIVTPVVVCGRNAQLRRHLSETGIGVALGWIKDMPTLLRAADVVIHNAGGLSCMEALAAGVPVLTYRPLSGHGRTNVNALAHAGLVAQAKNTRELHTLLQENLLAGVREVASGAVSTLWTKADAAAAIADLAASNIMRTDGIGVTRRTEVQRG